MRLFLDSSVIIDFLKGDETVRQAMREAEALYTSTLCAHEVLLGEKLRELRGLKSLYLKASLFFIDVETLPFTYADAVKASEIAATLIGKGKKIDDIDVLIAAQALAKSASVLSEDEKHFEVLKSEIGLQVEIAK